MNKKVLYFIVFLIAFLACLGWVKLTDKPNTIKPDPSSPLVTTTKPQPGFWDTFTPAVAVKAQFYPYLHFQKAMDDYTGKIPTYISFSAIPAPMRQAIIATEDRRFYEHGAVDPIGIIRALAVNIYSGETLEGGSTISQQVVKNVFLTQDRTWTRKIQEVLLAFLLEHYYSKDEILEIYLNTAYFGANATGIAEACQIYYGIKPEKLSLAQASLLAGLVQAPTYYNPLENYDAAKSRQKIVLTLMTNEGYISSRDAMEAYGTRLHLQP